MKRGEVEERFQEPRDVESEPVEPWPPVKFRGPRFATPDMANLYGAFQNLAMAAKGLERTFQEAGLAVAGMARGLAEESVRLTKRNDFKTIAEAVGVDIEGMDVVGSPSTGAQGALADAIEMLATEPVPPVAIIAAGKMTPETIEKFRVLMEESKSGGRVPFIIESEEGPPFEIAPVVLGPAEKPITIESADDTKDFLRVYGAPTAHPSNPRRLTSEGGLRGTADSEKTTAGDHDGPQ